MEDPWPPSESCQGSVGGAKQGCIAGVPLKTESALQQDSLMILVRFFLTFLLPTMREGTYHQDGR